MNAKRKFGELELEILKLITEHGSATVKEIQKSLGSGDKYTSIMTVMSRLVEKGELQREKIGLQYHYKLSLKKAQPELLERIKKKIFGNRTAPMVSFLLETDSKISDAELAEIEKTIRKLKDGKK
ncbi:MAG: BlaI/MecI/CopY family transcriptional regulator [Candidatus Algichlamydia australiensis]|nr:BlaI/MecI/CopY family transcriptional regulator [Chlamydiales bacterium]